MKTKTNFLLVLAFTLVTNLCIAGPPGSGWTLKFEENFNGNSINTSKWRIATWAEFKPSNLVVGNGVLTIKSVMNGCTKTGGWVDTGPSKHKFRYGYFEAKVRHEWVSRYIWPTWWIWGHHGSTELDVCEWAHWQFDAGKGPTQTHHVKDKSARYDGNTNVDASKWHTYAVLWTPSEITFYVDNTPKFSSGNPGDANDYLYLILSASPDKHTSPTCNGQLPNFYVDYVRVWQGGTPGGGGGDAQIVSLKCVGNNKYVSSENGAKPMNCNRAAVGAWEKFRWLDVGGGKTALRSDFKYVSSENGSKAMMCNRSSANAWEKFTVQHHGNQVYSFKGNNGKYMTGGSPMWCNAGSIGNMQKFKVTWGLKTAEDNYITASDELDSKIYPNPIVGDVYALDINLKANSEVSIKVFDNSGKQVGSKHLGELSMGLQSVSLSIDELNMSKQGMYFVSITTNTGVENKKVIIK